MTYLPGDMSRITRGLEPVEESDMFLLLIATQNKDTYARVWSACGLQGLIKDHNYIQVYSHI